MKLQSINMKPTKDIAKIATPHSVAHMVSPDEQAAAGKVLRDKFSNGNEVNERPNPIDFLHKSDAGRIKKLVAIRYERVLQSPFAFYRWSAFDATGTEHFPRVG
jgi:hypothetical protein